MDPSGANNVCCAICNATTTIPPPEMDMAQLICGGCRTLLMYTYGSTSVRCSCFHTVNLAPAPNIAHVNCGNRQTTLMYLYGAPSVNCVVCQYITNVNMGNVGVPIPMHRPVGPLASVPLPSGSAPLSQTVVVENPMGMFVLGCSRTCISGWGTSG